MATATFKNGYSVTVSYQKNPSGGWDAIGQIWNKNHVPIGEPIIGHGHVKTSAYRRAVDQAQTKSYSLPQD